MLKRIAAFVLGLIIPTIINSILLWNFNVSDYWAFVVIALSVGVYLFLVWYYHWEKVSIILFTTGALASIWLTGYIIFDVLLAHALRGPVF
jgi:hypothetical protein